MRSARRGFSAPVDDELELAAAKVPRERIHGDGGRAASIARKVVALETVVAEQLAALREGIRAQAEPVRFRFHIRIEWRGQSRSRRRPERIPEEGVDRGAGIGRRGFRVGRSPAQLPEPGDVLINSLFFGETQPA